MKNLCLIVLSLLISSVAFAEYKRAKPVSNAEYNTATNAVKKLKTYPGIEEYFKNAYAYIVFPTVGKGAAIVGAAHGNGLVFESGVFGYSLVGRSSLTQTSVGLAIGGQKYTEVVFFQDEAAFNRLKTGKVEFSGQSSAVFNKKSTSSDIAYTNGIAVFTINHEGLMAELSVAGQKVTYEPVTRQ
jgi:lipid-binding SYLF domain-containing protein